MIGTKITRGKGTGQKLRTVAGTFRTYMVRDTETCVRIYEREVKSVGMTGKKGSDPFWGVTGAQGATLGVRTGLSRASIQGTVFTRDSGRKVFGVVGSPSPVILQHEEGASPSGKVRIPTKWAQTAAGVDIFAGQSLRNIPGLFPVRLGNRATRTSGFWIAADRGLKRKNRESLVLLYLIRQAKPIPARGMFKVSLARVRTQLSGVMSYSAQVWASKANHLEQVS
jgi:hypothetical protein